MTWPPAAFWENKENICLCGPVGVGKSHIALALGHEAVRRGHDVRYIQAPRLFRTLEAARADLSRDRLIQHFCGYDFLIIDDFGLKPLTEEQADDLYDIVYERYQTLLDHYGMKWSRTQAGKAHENGDVEQAHHRLKRAIEQELLLRGSRDFLERDDYERFIQRIIERRNAGRLKRLGEELEVMAPLPDRRLEDFIGYRVKVSPSSTIRVRNNTYSVDSRLIREKVEVRMWADHLEVRYASQVVARMPRLRGEGKHRIDYRHVIHSLVRKPGAFARYRWREDLFPGVLFRVAYDELREDCLGTADRQYLGILELAAEEREQRVGQALKKLIERGCRVRLQVLKEALLEPASPAWGSPGP